MHYSMLYAGRYVNFRLGYAVLYRSVNHCEELETRRDLGAVAHTMPDKSDKLINSLPTYPEDRAQLGVW